MNDLIKRLRAVARKACERHNRVDQFDPTWERKPKDFIEWEAADEIERLQESCESWAKVVDRLSKEIAELRAQNERRHNGRANW